LRGGEKEIRTSPWRLLALSWEAAQPAETGQRQNNHLTYPAGIWSQNYLRKSGVNILAWVIATNELHPGILSGKSVVEGKSGVIMAFRKKRKGVTVIRFCSKKTSRTREAVKDNSTVLGKS